MNIKNHRNTRNSLPSLMLCWSLWVQWLHIFSNSWKRAWLKHTAWASQQSTQNTAARTHIISVWCENWCPKHHHTICLAFYFPAILLHRVDMQRYVSWCPVTTLTALLSSRDIPHPQKKGGREGQGWGALPWGSSCSMLPLAARACDDVIQTGACPVQGQALPVLVAQLCTGQCLVPQWSLLGRDWYSV